MVSSWSTTRCGTVSRSSMPRRAHDRGISGSCRRDYSCISGGLHHHRHRRPMEVEVTMNGEAMLTTLMGIELPEETARRMLGHAREFGLVNMSWRGKLHGLTYADGEYALGDADFSGIKR